MKHQKCHRCSINSEIIIITNVVPACLNCVKTIMRLDTHTALENKTKRIMQVDNEDFDHFLTNGTVNHISLPINKSNYEVSDFYHPSILIKISKKELTK